MPDSNQEASAGTKQNQVTQAVDQQIQGFEQQLQQKSNSELKEVATKLETVERNMLLQKIDSELQTIKETVVKPGDGAAATAGAAATVVNQKSNT
ncbi:Hypothetical protein LUCI_0416 [Lucifera butyrica]|uniref:Uncharacterized protein n=1 Tax=Lucifera butyrica TaxID=1351585 RepID=A0A498R223_9FIRM|nr:hypothetical protein [Lucifera butyrica]VBB05209.1 Hypothetical protein LUCI_0416 [Lucifera butyrica]